MNSSRPMVLVPNEYMDDLMRRFDLRVAGIPEFHSPDGRVFPPQVQEKTDPIKRFEDLQNIMHEAYMKVRGEVEEALVCAREDVEGETERCAKIADAKADYCKMHGDMCDTDYGKDAWKWRAEVAREIAAEIRRRP